MSFLRRLSRFCAGFFGSRPECQPIHALRTTDPLARFLTSKSHFSREKNRVKPAAFMPPADLKLSGYDVVTLDESSIWRLGELRVSGPQKKTLYGRGDVSVAVACQVGQAALDVVLDNDPPRHASICGWPSEKHERKSLALELAAEANLTLRSV